MKRSSPWLLAPVLFLANPAYLTSCSSGGYEFGETEMHELLDDVNAHQWEMDGYTLELDLHQNTGEATARRSVSSLVSSAHACGNRTFVESAAACIDTTEMGIAGTGWVIDEENQIVAEIPITGALIVDGWELTNAVLFLNFLEGEAVLSWHSRDGDTDEPQFVVDDFQAEGLGEDTVSINHTSRW